MTTQTHPEIIRIKIMTPQETIQALEGLGITRYRIATDTKINEKTLSNWANGKSKPFKSNANVAVLEKYYKSVCQTLTSHPRIK